MKKTVFFLVILLILSSTAMADGDFAGMVAKVNTQTASIGTFIKVVSGIIGVGLLLGALVIFANMKKPGNQMSPITPLLMLVIGILLVSFGAFVDIGTNSIFDGEISSKKLIWEGSAQLY
jgi:ATP/ADP translocase